MYTRKQKISSPHTSVSRRKKKKKKKERDGITKAPSSKISTINYKHTLVVQVTGSRMLIGKPVTGCKPAHSSLLLSELH
jgi:hypothetical protein